MTIKPAIRTNAEIDKIVRDTSGTWVRRRNVRKTLVRWSNELVNQRIELVRELIRRRKAEGFNQRDLREYYSDITDLEIQLLLE